MDDGEGKIFKREAAAGGERAREAFAELWKAYYRRLICFAASYRGLSRSDYDDLVSDVLIKAFTGLKSYDPARPLSAWIYKIASNHFSDARKRTGRVSHISIGDQDDGTPFITPVSPFSHTEEAENRDLTERCRKIIKSLDEKERRIAYLRFFENMNATEIGTVLKLPAGTVRWKINGIRKNIAARLGGKNHEDR
ncbi:sigma-70 family RNA polymerase sigma factor [Treponema sp. OttesenSCG-928-L16]|nr:sigma-70 family RNA polymerase sigma factor [Treponema sp. OttesenSCG-928-L16]